MGMVTILVMFIFLFLLYTMLYQCISINDPPKFECQSKNYKQDTEITILSFVNKACVMFLFTLVQHTSKISVSSCQIFYLSFVYITFYPYLAYNSTTDTQIINIFLTNTFCF